MVLGRSGDEDIPTLIARKNYTRAIELIRKQLSTRRNDPRLRLQLGDVLVSAGKEAEGVSILLPLADEFAKEGFAAKAISVLKKIQKLEPGRRDIDQRLASLIQEKQRHATVTLPTSSSGGGLEIGMEEIGIEPPVARSGPAPVPVRRPEPEPEMEIGLAPPAAPPAAPHAPAPPPAPAPASGDLELTLEDAPLPEGTLSLEADPLPLDLEPASAPAAPRAPAPPPAAPPPAPEAEPELLTLEPAPEGEPEPELEITPVAEPAPVVDQDLLTGEFEEIEPLEEPGEESAPLDPMTDSRFAEELMSAIDGAFDALPASSTAGGSADAAPEPEAGAQIVVSPLFKDFSVEELVAVIQGLNLLSFDRGQVIIREGDPGNSLYMLTSGTVKAFMKREGKQVPINELEEGAFFGEVSMLTGKPRSATIVAKTRCELLELDRATLDSITQSHPHVREVLQEFANQRMANRA